MLLYVLAAAAALQTVAPGEEPVDPYKQNNANAGATPFKGVGMLKAFHGRAGIGRMTDDFVDRLVSDNRIADIFKGHDIVRLRRTLKEQFCYILNGGCSYTGRNMRDSHKDLGVQTADMGALVEDLQAALRKEHIAFRAQDRFIAKLAPIKRDAVRH